MLRARARAFRIGISNTGLLLYFGQPGSQNLRIILPKNHSAKGMFLDLVITKPIYFVSGYINYASQCQEVQPGQHAALPSARETRYS